MENGTNQNSVDYAGFWVRVGSTMIDGLILSLVTMPVSILLMQAVHSKISSDVFFAVFFFYLLPLINVLYFAWFNAEGRQSPGKKYFGLRVVNASFQPIVLAQSFWRAVIYVVNVIGILLVPLNQKKRAWHDFLAKTYVIRIKPRRNSEALLLVLALAGNAIFGILLALPVRQNYVQAYRIPTGSLKPTLLIGDFILIDKYWAKQNAPKRGDWVVFKYPIDPQLDYIKRCIGLPGDTVAMHDGVVWINGVKEPLQFPRREYDPEEGHYVLDYEVNYEGRRPYRIRHYEDHNLKTENYGPIIVPPAHYFVMGDNRDNSADSRYWGFVPRENVVGKAGIIYWSWDRAVPIYRLIAKIRWSRIGNVLQ